MPPFRVLNVCIGNVCRSPVGERLLAAEVADRDIEVTSAGVGAMAGSPMSPEAAVDPEAHGGSADGFVSRRLTPAMVEESDLVLTATKAIRARVPEDSPTALRRTFTVRELAALLDVETADGDLSVLIRTAAEQRSRAARDDYDIPDPYRRGEEADVLACGSDVDRGGPDREGPGCVQMRPR